MLRRYTRYTRRVSHPSNIEYEVHSAKLLVRNLIRYTPVFIIQRSRVRKLQSTFYTIKGEISLLYIFHLVFIPTNECFLPLRETAEYEMRMITRHLVCKRQAFNNNLKWIWLLSASFSPTLSVFYGLKILKFYILNIRDITLFAG